MKKILVLVLALLCVFSVAAMAETEEFKVDLGSHKFLTRGVANSLGMTKEELAEAGYTGNVLQSDLVNVVGGRNYYGDALKGANLFYVSYTPGTCTSGATYTFKCVEEGCSLTNNLITVTVNEPSHIGTQTEVTNDPRNKAAECDSEGAQVYYCSECEKEWIKTLAKIPHTWGDEEVVAPTCTEKGYTLKICKVCKAEDKSNYTDALKHDFDLNEDKKVNADDYSFVVITPATCVAKGEAKMMLICEHEGCNATAEGFESKYVELPVVDHYKAANNSNADYVNALMLKGISDELYIKKVAETYVIKDADNEGFYLVLPAFDTLDADDGNADNVATHTVNQYALNATTKVTIVGNYVITVVPATCEKDGSLTIACANCEESVVYPIKALGHSYVVEKRVGEPLTGWDCTKGYNLYVKCIVCKESFQQNTMVHEQHAYTQAAITQKLGNNQVVSVGEVIDLNNTTLKKAVATLIDNGDLLECVPYTVTYYCTCELEMDVKLVETYLCAQTSFTVMPATEDHVAPEAEEDEYIIVPSTCKEAGYELFHCADCYTAARIDYEIDEDGHNVKEWTTTPATCEEDGLKSGVCTICGETIEQAIVKTGHDWDKKSSKAADWNVEPKTCEEDGRYYRTCNYCDKVEEVKIPAGHFWAGQTEGIVDESEIGKSIISYTPSTCTTNGSISYHCVECHETVGKEQLDKLPHRMHKAYLRDESGEIVVEEDKKVTAGALVPANCCNAAQYLYECDYCNALEVRFSTSPAEQAYGHNELTDEQMENIELYIAGKLNDSMSEDYDALKGNIYYVTPATCETAGHGYFLCDQPITTFSIKNGELDDSTAYCKYQFEFEIKALGHMWKTTADANGVYTSKCVNETGEVDEFGAVRVGCGKVETVEVRTPEYKIAIEGKVGTLTKADDNMTKLNSKAYVRIVLDFQTKDGVSTSMVFMADVTFTGEVGTFKVPVVKTGMTMTGSSFVVVTDENADELRYSQITNKYGELNL